MASLVRSRSSRTAARSEPKLSNTATRQRGGRPPKPIEEHLRDGTFRPGRHGDRVLAELGNAATVEGTIGVSPRLLARRGEASGPGSSGEHFAEFCAQCCVHTVGEWAGDAFVLEPWQRQFADELLSFDERGQRV